MNVNRADVSAIAKITAAAAVSAGARTVLRRETAQLRWPPRQRLILLAVLSLAGVAASRLAVRDR